MFGWVNFLIGNTQTRAVLTSSRVWKVSPHPPGAWIDRFGERLQKIADDYRGPSDGFYGPRQIHAAAKLLDGHGVIMPIPAHTPERIY